MRSNEPKRVTTPAGYADEPLEGLRRENARWISWRRVNANPRRFIYLARQVNLTWLTTLETEAAGHSLREESAVTFFGRSHRAPDGFTNVDSQGIGGVEKSFDKRLTRPAWRANRA